ncbi:unnamed protein product [Sympodiomycopsis kandeliae]
MSYPPAQAHTTNTIASSSSPSPSPSASRYSTPISSPILEQNKLRREAETESPPLPPHQHLYSAPCFKRARTTSPSCPSSPASIPTAANTPVSIMSGAPHIEQSGGMSLDTEAEAGNSVAHLHIDDDGDDLEDTPQQRLDRIESLLAQPIQPGQHWYPIPKQWYHQWQTACRQHTQPEPLDCSLVAHNATQLKPALEEDHDYVLAPEKAIQLFLAWHGDSGGPLFKRKVIQVDSAPPTLELYTPQVAFSLITASVPATSSADVKVVSLSRACPLSALKEAATESLQLSAPIEDVRLWSVPPDASPSPFTLLSKVVQGQVSGAYSLLQDGAPFLDRSPTDIQPIAVEIKGDHWPTETTASQPQSSVKGIFAQTEGDYWSKLQQSSSSSSSSSSSAPPPPPQPSTSAQQSSSSLSSPPLQTRRKPSRTRGLKGLANLGNTCFMNSALQCLSNTPELKDYFVSKVFEQEINEDNPLGNQGALARAFGNLIQQLWSGQGTSLVPRDFKWALARFAPQFSGYAQQDTQELLAFLLDGLHEDLNRIKKKPYIEAPDWEGGGLEEMVRFAKRQWEIYKMRNDSVIVDLFQGQYRSTLVCPECSKVSIKFDPFMYLTLPLPNTSLWRHQVIFVPFDPSQSMKRVNLALPAETSLAKLKQTLAEMFNAKYIMGAEIFQMKLYRFFHDYEPAHNIEKADHAVFWELPFELPTSSTAQKDQKTSSSVSACSSNRTHSPMAQSPIAEEKYGNCPAPGWQDDQEVLLPVYTHSIRGRAALGIPFFIRVKKEECNDVQAVQSNVVQQYARFIERHAELVQIINDQQQQQQQKNTLPSESTSTSTPEEWEVVDADAHSHTDVVNVHDTIEDEEENDSDDVVTEIRPDGQIIESCDFRASQRRQSAARLPPVVQMLSQSGSNNDNNNQNSDAPFELHYMAASASSKRPIFKDVENWGHASEELTQRWRRLTDAATESTTDRIPLVYRGGALVCVWNEQAADEFLPPCAKDGSWGTNFDDVDDARTSQEKKEAASNGGRARRGKEQLNIENCLDEFTKEEQLGSEDPWYCPQCKEFRQATKKFDLWKVPDILVVHLKRFSAGRGLRDKIDTVVDFPLTGFDLSERVRGAKAVRELKAQGKLEDLASSIVLDTGTAGVSTPADGHGTSANSDALGAGAQDLNASILSAISEANDDAVASDAPIYDLFAVDNHYGGLGGGHYTTSAKNAEDDQWYYFDDSSVRRVDVEEVKGSAAYLLFYRRRTTRPIGGKSREIVKSHVASQPGQGGEVEGDGDDEDGEELPNRRAQKARRPFVLDQNFSDESSAGEEDTTMDTGNSIIRMDENGHPLNDPPRPLGLPQRSILSEPDSDSDSSRGKSWRRRSTTANDSDEHLPSPTISESSEPFDPNSMTTTTFTTTRDENSYISYAWDHTPPPVSHEGKESPPPPYHTNQEEIGDDPIWKQYAQKALSEQHQQESSSDEEEEEE